MISQHPHVSLSVYTPRKRCRTQYNDDNPNKRLRSSWRIPSSTSTYPRRHNTQGKADTSSTPRKAFWRRLSFRKKAAVVPTGPSPPHEAPTEGNTQRDVKCYTVPITEEENAHFYSVLRTMASPVEEPASTHDDPQPRATQKPRLSKSNSKYRHEKIPYPPSLAWTLERDTSPPSTESEEPATNTAGPFSSTVVSLRLVERERAHNDELEFRITSGKGSLKGLQRAYDDLEQSAWHVLSVRVRG